MSMSVSTASAAISMMSSCSGHQTAKGTGCPKTYHHVSRNSYQNPALDADTSTLNEKEEEMFSKMEISSEHQLHKQLDRIETLLRNKTVKKKQERDEGWYTQYTVREIFDQFNDTYEPVLSLKRNILVLLRESDACESLKDVRVLFALN